MAAARIEAVLGDITTEDVDAIVNAANQDLAQGGGVCGAIFAAAGGRELAAACATLGGCPSGDAKATGVGARSLAFPAISTGIYGFPPDRAAGIAVRTVVAAASASAVAERVGLDLVRLVAFDRPTFARYQQLLEPRSPVAPPKPGPPNTPP
jgi:O-acetyl-ADP-ribose deacetylase